MLAARRWRPQRQDLLQDAIEADRSPRHAPRPGEDEQVPHDLGGAIGFAVDGLHLAPQLFREGAGRAEQLHVPQHALQRVVQLVRDAGDELAERRQLL